MASEKVLQAKQAVVAELTAKINGAVAGVIVDYSGITVADDTALRRELITRSSRTPCSSAPWMRRR